MEILLHQPLAWKKKTAEKKAVSGGVKPAIEGLRRGKKLADALGVEH